MPCPQPCAFALLQVRFKPKTRKTFVRIPVFPSHAGRFSRLSLPFKKVGAHSLGQAIRAAAKLTSGTIPAGPQGPDREF